MGSTITISRDRPRASNSQTVAGGLIVRTGTCYEHNSLSSQRLTAVSAPPPMVQESVSILAVCMLYNRRSPHVRDEVDMALPVAAGRNIGTYCARNEIGSRFCH